MSKRNKPVAKANIPDIHAESVEELREAFDLFDIKGIGEYILNTYTVLVVWATFHDIPV